jgi:hypothetical protein
MATIRLPADFRDFLKLLNSHRVEYLLIGGYAVCYHGYYRNAGAGLISLPDLVKNKLKSGRLKDLDDARRLN